MNGIGTKAIAGAGSIPLSAQLVSIALYLLGASPPQDIVLAIQGVVSAVLAYAAIYYTPYNPPPPAQPVPVPPPA